MLIDESSNVTSDQRISVTNPGILDFQDSVVGPVCYDLVSLLRDCYICWPSGQVKAWVHGYYVQLVEQNVIPAQTSPSEFQRWFDWMGMQRHLKAIGIFARLKLRDDKPEYLPHIPRTLAYILKVGQIYPELYCFTQWIEKNISPAVSRNLGLTDSSYPDSH
jgi:N-acetylmuramate 1-kinase